MASFHILLFKNKSSRDQGASNLNKRNGYRTALSNNWFENSPTPDLITDSFKKLIKSLCGELCWL